ncbi:hypothetical protein BSKO_08840 [Bryopsis sp. KO-2023]|nr:hypothetical protein BSKO_08840 [Bryopsis sp. KO-2023]
MEVAKTLSSSKDKDDSEDYLFNPPEDLVCPITHQLFKDPVVNSAGSMYEREAILHFLESSENPVDPVTREELTGGLFTVLKHRSRVIEYRESVARTCIDIACRKDCDQPVKYLRRAADLCSEVNVEIPGLTPECVEQLRRSSDNAYDADAMKKFAEGLLSCGDRDKAAAVYYNLLTVGDDKDRQAELLKRCVECWSGASGEPVNYTYQKFTEFVMNQEAFSWGQIIDIVHKAGISEKLALRLCEELLNQPVEAGSAHWNEQRDVLVKYVGIQCQSLKDKQGWTETEVQQILEWKEKLSKTREIRPRGTTRPISALREHRKPFFLRKKFLASVVFGIANFIDGPNIILKLARTVPVLYLFNAKQ